jgi:hypothetical protein
MFPFDILEQAFQGNSVAWEAMFFGIFSVALFFFIIVLWWKMPQLAKSQFINNTIGGQKPTMVQCYDNKRVRFFNPTLMRSGFATSKGAVYIFPKTWIGADELPPAERDIFNSVYTMDGTQSSLFLNYSIQAGVMNPGLVAMIEHEKKMQQLKPGSPVNVKRTDLLKILNMIKDETIQLSPLYFSFPISDIRNLKSWLPKSMSKSNFAEYENKIRQDERGNKEGLDKSFLIIILLLVQLAIGGIGLAKQMGWI